VVGGVPVTPPVGSITPSVALSVGTPSVAAGGAGWGLVSVGAGAGVCVVGVEGVKDVELSEPPESLQASAARLPRSEIDARLKRAVFFIEP
jgi:hypothetical protein